MIIARKTTARPTPSPGTPGEGRGEGFVRLPDAHGIRQNPHPDLLPAYRERGKSPAAQETP
jgi:hypothetical protein